VLRVIARRIRRLLPLALPFAALVVVVAGGGLAAIETDTVADFGEGVWWALSLMTTVGFAGDTPQTTGGRIVSAVLMLIGFGLVTLTTAAIASLLVSEEEEPRFERERELDHEMLAELRGVRERLSALEDRLPGRG
jgi:voltage-gated potassium channel